MCQRTLAGVVKPEYKGETITAGFVLTTGWENMFVAIPTSYSWTRLDDGKEANALTVSRLWQKIL